MDTSKPVIWKDEAKEDLRDILHYLSKFPLAYVDEWSDELTRKIHLLELFPEMGRIVLEKQLSHFRELLVGNYRVLYIYLNDLITIVAVRHQASQLSKI